MGYHSASYLEATCKAVHEASCIQGKIKWGHKRSLTLQLTLQSQLDLWFNIYVFKVTK